MKEDMEKLTPAERFEWYKKQHISKNANRIRL
jgi:hypothetical protein